MRAACHTGLRFRFVLAGLFVLASLGAMLGTGKPAPRAVTPLRSAPGPILTPRRLAPRIPGRRFSTSSNWSGYAAYNQSNVTDVWGSWTVPTALSSPCSNAGNNTYSSAWVGIDGYSDNTVEQTGTDSDYGPSGASYYAWYEMYPKFSVTISTNVLPGDSMQAAVHYLGSGSFQLTISDTRGGSTAWSYSTTQQNKKAHRTSAEWIEEAPSSLFGVLPLAHFSDPVLDSNSIYFSGCQAKIGGLSQPLGGWSPLDPITMVGSTTGDLEAQPSDISGGNSFSVTWFNCR